MSDDIAFRFLTWSALCPSCPPSRVGYHVRHAIHGNLTAFKPRRTTFSALRMPVLRRMPVRCSSHSRTGHAYVQSTAQSAVKAATACYGSAAATRGTFVSAASQDGRPVDS